MTKWQAGEADAALLSHLAVSHSFFSLLPIVLSPSLVGEQLLDWLNTLDPAPSSEEGIDLASRSEPWRQPNYWDFVVKAVLRGHLTSAAALLGELRKHADADVVDTVDAVVELIEATPRSSDHHFATEREYVSARRKWLQSVKRLSTEVDGWSPDDHEVQTGLSTLTAILRGDQSSLLQASDDLREAVACWGIWVNPSMRASNVPSVVDVVAKELPTDSTDIEQVVTRAMLEQDWLKALQAVHSVSPFLSAHIVALLPVELHPRVGAYEPLERYFYRSYADALSLRHWKAKVTYLERAGAASKAQAVLLTSSTATTDAIDDRIRIASSFGWEETVRSLCVVEANACASRREWGNALAYELRAGQRPRIERFVRSVLTLYVTQGAEEFVRTVDSLPTSLLVPYASDNDDDARADAEHPSLVFLARYRDFLALYARGQRVEAGALLMALLRSGVGARFGFEAVMLLDAMPLLEPAILSRDDCMELLRILESPSGSTVADQLVVSLVGSHDAAEKQFRILRARIALCI